VVVHTGAGEESSRKREMPLTLSSSALICRVANDGARGENPGFPQFGRAVVQEAEESCHVIGSSLA
jgi:hypothetical protein